MVTASQNLDAALRPWMDFCAFLDCVHCLQHDPQWTHEEIERLEEVAWEMLSEPANSSCLELTEMRPGRLATEQLADQRGDHAPRS